MFQKYRNFIRGVSVNSIGKAGVVLTTSSFITFWFVEIMRLLGIFTNAYMGLVTYLLFPSLFVVGLILIPIGWRKYQQSTGKSTKELLAERFDPTDVEAKAYGSRLFILVSFLTLFNVVFLSISSMRMMDFMDKPQFCGNACHQVMSPEWTTFQVSPHARVACVKCHVGDGVKATIDSKLNGVWQIISASLDLYEKPIPTPVHNLRPASETCQKCHWPEKFYGYRLKSIVQYDFDEQSTPRYTTLNLKIDAGKDGNRAGIHWHIDEKNEVRYTSVNDKRQEMIWVEVRQPDGTYKRYINKKLKDSDYEPKEVRVMDCVDCHNRATHIYEDPEKAIDKRIRQGLIDRTLPYIKREGLAAITNNYPSKEAGLKGIVTHIEGFYRRNYPDIATQKMDKIDAAIKTLQEIYKRNIFPQMNITWGSYPNHIAHPDEKTGCFRCHNENMVDKKGKPIANDCTLCHSILANRSRDPFKFLKEPEKKDPDFRMHQTLRKEFFESFVE